MNNIVKHANASRINISIISEDNEISVMIEDNGIGYDQSSKYFSAGIGLKNIQNRIEYLKGTVDISSEPGKGTLVALYVPLES
ncbi:MAG: hypothetical protein H7223_07055 [Pedobacter sp.]|nr:hypothetical protein [Pedobacter sp.]